ncbi:UNVERIFIED_CONTAM: hypothetical protein Sradi_3257700 [Sesamum radiatum]|uniref:MAGE domain-containing protein n=1 Tax=Sesamum radiatum TaxID=300843 RepID=A0AAW2R0C7_SESRA
MSEAPEIFSQFDISEHEKEKLVGEVIRYIMFKTEQNSGCPIRREELTQLITGRSRPSVSVNPGRASQSQQCEFLTGLKNVNEQLPADIYRKFVEDTSSSHMTGFTFVVIGIIHLGGGKVTEESLWHHLRRLGLHENEENHPDFANTKLALEALVQKRYLQKEKVNGPEGSTVYYELAERALDGTINDRIKEYVSQIVQKDVTSLEAD